MTIIRLIESYEIQANYTPCAIHPHQRHIPSFWYIASTHGTTLHDPVIKGYHDRKCCTYTFIAIRKSSSPDIMIKSAVIILMMLEYLGNHDAIIFSLPVVNFFMESGMRMIFKDFFGMSFQTKSE